MKRSQIHFVHCLVSRKDVGGAEEKVPHPCAKPEAAAVAAAWDIPTLRVQLSGAQILEALRLYRIGMAVLASLLPPGRGWLLLLSVIRRTENE